MHEPSLLGKRRNARNLQPSHQRLAVFHPPTIIIWIRIRRNSYPKVERLVLSHQRTRLQENVVKHVKALMRRSQRNKSHSFKIVGPHDNWGMMIAQKKPGRSPARKPRELFVLLVGQHILDLLIF